MRAVAVKLESESGEVPLEFGQLLVQTGRLRPKPAELATGGAPQASEAATATPKPRKVAPLLLSRLSPPAALSRLAPAPASKEVEAQHQAPQVLALSSVSAPAAGAAS